MKILLINPPYTRFKGMLDRYFPLGLGYIGAVLRNKGHEAAIYNAENPAVGECEVNWDFTYRLEIFEEFIKRMKNENDFVYKEVEKVIKDFDPDVVGITCKTVTFESARIIAKIVKKIKNIPVVFGGPHPSVMPEKVIEEKNCDFVLVGEAEETFSDLIDKFMKNEENFEEIAGIYFKSKGKIINNPNHAIINNLNSLPISDRSLMLNVYNYSKRLMSSMVGGIIGSRGCPYKCRFCSGRNVFGRTVRWRDPNLIIDEIKYIMKEYNTIEFYFWDDSFTLNKKRLTAFCDLVIDKKVNFAWGCHTRADLIDDDTVKKLKKAGCFKISMGIESGCDETLKYIDKRISLKDVEKASNILNKHNMDWNATFIIGFPLETEQQMYATFNFMKKIKPTRIFLSVFSPFPGTDLYEETKSLGLIKDDIDWSRVETKSPYNAFVKNVSEERLKEIFREMTLWIDEYNKNSDNFFKKLKIRMPFYRKHPILFLKRTIEFLYRIYINNIKNTFLKKYK